MASVTAPGLPEAHHLDVPPRIEAAATTEHGRVEWFCADRGFGWVRADDDSAVFMSFRDLPGTGFRCVDAGTRIRFVRDVDQHGDVARSVQVLDGTDASAVA